MLPKPEKIKKTKTAEQLDLVDTLSLEKKRKYKRQFVLLCLIITTGLSFSLWAYHSGRQFFSSTNFSQIKIGIKLPSIKMSDIKLSSDNFNSTINQIIASDKNHWSIYAKTLSGDSSFSINSQDFTTDSQTVVDNLSKLPYSSNSLIQNSLPQGTKIQESDTNYLATTPQQKILFEFKNTGPNSDNSKQLIPSLVEKLYWYLILK